MSNQDISPELVMGEYDPDDASRKPESQKVVDSILAYISKIVTCIKSGSDDWDPEDLNNIVADAMRAASAKAQEECAKIAEGLDSPAAYPMCPRDVAAAIRAVELE